MGAGADALPSLEIDGEQYVAIAWRRCDPNNIGQQRHDLAFPR
jgi:hypothetical protein